MMCTFVRRQGFKGYPLGKERFGIRFQILEDSYKYSITRHTSPRRGKILVFHSCHVAKDGSIALVC